MAADTSIPIEERTQTVHALVKLLDLFDQAPGPISGRDFLTAIAQQVLLKKFITIKQYQACARIMRNSGIQALLLEHPEDTGRKVPPDIKWVQFDEPTIGAATPTPTVVEQAKRGIDFSSAMPSSAGTLLVKSGRLCFNPRRPNPKILQSLGYKFRDGLWVGPEFTPEALGKFKSLVESFEQDASVSDAMAARVAVVDLPDEVAEHGTLMDFQKQSIQFLLSHDRAYLALAPGLGKTATSIFAATEHLKSGKVGNVLVVAPLSLLSNWQAEIMKWVGQESIIDHPDYTIQPIEACWHIINYDALSLGRIKLTGWDLIIFDETILLKSHDREQVQVAGVKKWVFKTKRVQAAAELAKGARVVWHLSGGPSSRYVDDLWAQFHILDPKRFSGYWKWAEQYCVVEDDQWGKRVIGNRPHAVSRVQEDYADLMFARSQDQVIDLPEWIFMDVDVPMAKKQEQLYNQMLKEWLVTIQQAGGATVQLFAPNVLTQMLRLTQIASNPILLGQGITAISPKWYAVKELLEVHGTPAIVWTQFVETAQRMESWLRREGLRVACLTGDTPAPTRADIVNKFQSGDLDVLVAHPRVGKFGLTLTAARSAIYLERSYDGDDYYQSLHRIRRIGTKSSPVVIHLRSVQQTGAYTVDHLVGDVLSSKAETTFQLTTGELVQYLSGDAEE